LHLERRVVCTFFLLAVSAVITTAQTPASGKRACQVNKAAASEADIANARGDYAKAALLYADAVSKTPSDEVRAAQIRNLLDQHKLTQALSLATAFATAEPSSPMAVETMAEVRFREGDLPESYVLTARAMAMDPCNARVYLAAAGYENLAGLHATAKKHLEVAHQLDPINYDIYVAWIETLPLPQRIAEEQSYLENTKVLADKVKGFLKTDLQREKASDHPCTLVSSGKPAPVPFQPIDNVLDSDFASWGLEVQFNGKRRNLQIDTGASGILLTRGAAAGLGIIRDKSIEIDGVGDNGGNGAYLGHAEKIQIDGMEFRDCSVTVLASNGALGGGDQMGERMDTSDGLIGSDIFRNHLVTLDYPAHQLRLDPLPPRPGQNMTEADQLWTAGMFSDSYDSQDRYIAPEMQKWTRVYRRRHLIVVPTHIGSAGTKLFLLDTGSQDNMISPEAAREVTGVKEGIAVVRGLSGYSKTYETQKVQIDFGGVRQPMRSMMSIDTTGLLNSVGVVVSGFLGYPTLSQLVIHIDYRDNLVSFERLPSKN
jgi:Aspartyl protease